MELTDISYEKADGVAEVALNRPERRNAISGREGGTRDQILYALLDAEADGSVGSFLLRGEGSTFSAGGDLTGNAPRETFEEHSAFLESVDTFHRRLGSSPLPVVAAVQGLCLGAALSLAVSCDMVIAGDDARFGLPEGRIGLVGVTPLVPLIGAQWAKFLMLTGEMIDAETARSIGLVLTVEPADELLERARDLCRRLARLPREASALNLATVDAVAECVGDERRRTAIEHDAATLLASARATAPDGRTFRDIIATEGIAGLKAARAAQYDSSWLR
jgi:enoyl-CoA hydratase/carnithine racemase